MLKIPDIQKSEISIDTKHTQGLDEKRCVEALWNVYNIIKKIKSDENTEDSHLSLIQLQNIGVHAVLKIDGISSLAYNGMTNKKWKGGIGAGKILFKLEKYGFIFSELVTAKDAPKNKLSGKDIEGFVFSYGGSDFKDVILGLKLFADALVGQPYNGFHTADIRCMYKGVKVYSPQSDISMEGILKEDRFNIISDVDKTFILAFDKAINELEHDFGTIIGSGFGWGLYMINYGKSGTKSRPIAARIYIKDDGKIQLRLPFVFQHFPAL